ncbi:DNA mismatch repair protein MutT [Pseudoxanthomonas kalamensis DSM 18571]|uniref:Nudix family hydrolase n=1 Tax=Pseudoxanthomonas kalamensis TaxID=289483 RepID=UPI001391EF88|nr:Nudix family hydrolase [Pseudoxanthomonas kalamensis]KAF1708834.1 DNA mismatch repair protein MutT [Pseudoxanthomonas kalamensis DSM 18571]
MKSSLRSIHVVAGLITDPKGRVLLARRTEASDHGGLWEFPGGKREPGETSEQALVRELQEELGIAVEVGERLMEVPQRYPDKRLRLELRRVTSWSGKPRGIEGQALSWVARDKLTRYHMPPADRPVVGMLLDPDRYLVTPEPQGDGSDWLLRLGMAVDDGIARVQLRVGDPARWSGLLEQAVARCRKAGAEALVGGDIELALRLGAGVQLRAAQLAGLDRRPLPAELPVAASCHTAEELQHAQRLDCDFAVLGSLQATPSHPGIAPLGWTGFDALRESVSLPLYAIGGLGPDDIPQARNHGAQGIAAIRALWPKDL